MLSFHQIVLRKFLLVFSLLFFVLGAIVYYWTKDFYITQTKDSLLQNIEFISFNLDDKSDLDGIASKTKEKLNLRLTVIAFDGEVLSESHKDKTKMDNHKYRDEIMQADKEEYGYKIRHSNTLDKDLLYIAKKHSLDSEVIYIRLAKELKNINEEIFDLGIKTLIALTIFFVFIFILSYKFSTKLEKEIQKIAIFLSAIAKKEKPSYITSELSLEFYNITKLLSKVSIILNKKNKKKSKYTAKLQDLNQQKDDIISAISHEFKNPIAVINGYSQTLLEDKELNPAIRDKFLSKIYKNGEKLSDLINTLRLSIKLDNGQQQLDFTTINLYELVCDSLENIKVGYPNREAHIKGNKDITIKADNALFSVIVSNLIENAFKYSEDEVLISFDEKSLNVVDTGIGISKTNLADITNKFFRVHENSWNNSLGLGLFLVNNITSLHHFTLKIQSIENEGSTFSIIF